MFVINSRLPPAKSSSKLPPTRGINSKMGSKKPPMPMSSYMRQKSRRKNSEDGSYNHHSRRNSRSRADSRGKQKKSNVDYQLQYNEYLKKLSEENRKKRERNQQKDSEIYRNKNYRSRVSRSRVSSVDANQNREHRNYQAYGNRPIWWG